MSAGRRAATHAPCRSCKKKSHINCGPDTQNHVIFQIHARRATCFHTDVDPMRAAANVHLEVGEFLLMLKRPSVRKEEYDVEGQHTPATLKHVPGDLTAKSTSTCARVHGCALSRGTRQQVTVFISVSIMCSPEPHPSICIKHQHLHL